MWLKVNVVSQWASLRAALDVNTLLLLEKQNEAQTETGRCLFLPNRTFSLVLQVFFSPLLLFIF